jgi:hypothetical protein
MNPMSSMTPASIDAILDGAPVLRQRGDEPLFSDEQMSLLVAAGGSEARLLDIVRAAGQPLARRAAAVEALAQRQWNTWQTSPADSAAVASVLAEAMVADRIHNHWGLPGAYVGHTGEILVGARYGVAEALAPLLDNHTALTIVGSETATMQALHMYRIADLVAWLIGQHRREPWVDRVEPVERDVEIERLRVRLGQPG